MDGWLAPILVALIGGPLMWLLHRFDRRNTSQHESNMGVLNNIEKKVDRLDSRMDDHFEWHMTKKDS